MRDIAPKSLCEETRMRLQHRLHSISKELRTLSKKLNDISNRVDYTPKPRGRKRKPETQKVIALIRNSRRAMDARTLKTKTGFGNTKIRNVIFQALRRGEIRRVGRGLYSDSQEN
jgi:hypothetical protein